MQIKNILAAAGIAAGLSALPLTYTPQSGVAANTACAQVKLPPSTGTCCGQNNAVCITPHGNIWNAYYKSEGPC